MSMRSVSDVALDLGVSVERVRQLIGSGVLPAERVAGRWVLPDSVSESVERRLVGRPWSEAACWGVLWFGLGRPAPWLSVKQRQRARYRWVDGIEEHHDRLRARSRAVSFSAHPSALSRIAEDARFVRGGVSSVRDYGSDLLVGDVAEGYVRLASLSRFSNDFGLEELSVGSGNVVLRVVDSLWPFENDERVVPALAVALDLAESADQRTQRAGRALLARELKRLRR
jgi:hypothetical protein